jgi:hypothetical protein
MGGSGAKNVKCQDSRYESRYESQRRNDVPTLLRVDSTSLPALQCLPASLFGMVVGPDPITKKLTQVRFHCTDWLGDECIMIMSSGFLKNDDE